MKSVKELTQNDSSWELLKEWGHPDTLDWENLDMGYSEFIKWTFVGDISKFYETFRWQGWQSEIVKISSEEGISVYPFLWAEGPEIDQRSRSVVPLTELWDLANEYRKKFGLI